jgi:hypothetical protein
MNEKLHEPVYRAAIDMARTDLGEIAELIDQLRARQEQLCSAVEALELVVGSADQPPAVRPAATPVYEINSRNPQTAQSSQRVIDPKVLNSIEPHIKDALRAQALA